MLAAARLTSRWRVDASSLVLYSILFPDRSATPWAASAASCAPLVAPEVATVVGISMGFFAAAVLAPDVSMVTLSTFASASRF